jgi:hypothetical protein
MAYDFRLRAESGQNVSGWVELANVRTEYCDARPIAPSNLTATVLSGDGVALVWVDNSDNEEFFIVYRHTGIGGAPFDVVGVVAAGSETFTDASAECGATYTYAVASFSSVLGGGASALSQEVTVSTPPCVEDRGSRLVTVACMLLDGDGAPVSDGQATVSLALFDGLDGGQELLVEHFVTSIRNGYLSVHLGATSAVDEIVDTHDNLYVEVRYLGHAVLPRFALTSAGSLVHSPHMLSGGSSPVGLVSAPKGTLYLNTAAGKLYFKYGDGPSDWTAAN